MTPILHIIPFSHFSEKGMWILDYKGLRYEARALRNPGSRSRIARLTGGSRTLPVLQHGSMVVSDSTDIALFAEREYPQPPLLPTVEPLRSECLLIEDWADEEIGFHTRRWLMGHVLFEAPDEGKRLLAEAGVPAPVTELGLTFLSPWMARMFDTSAEKARVSASRITEQLRTLRDKLANRRFLVGDTFTLADLAVCALLIPIGNIGPWRHAAEFAEVFAWRETLCRLHGRRATLLDRIPDTAERARRGRSGAEATAKAGA